MVNILNDVPVSNYMRNDLEDQLTTNLIFENITVVGNIIVDESQQHVPDLIRLDAESVKLTGR